jgi:Na+/melibiose symporter-like transporter
VDIPIILIKITGVALLIWTIRSIYIHVKEKRKPKNQDKKEEQSVSEQILNNTLLYLWLLFMLTFSIGMIVNN